MEHPQCETLLARTDHPALSKSRESDHVRPTFHALASQSTLYGPSQGAICSTLDSRIVTRSLTGLERRPDGPFTNTADTVVTPC